MIVDAFLEDYPDVTVHVDTLGRGVVRLRAASLAMPRVGLYGSNAEIAHLEAALAAHRERMRAVPHQFPEWVLERTQPRRYDPASEISREERHAKFIDGRTTGAERDEVLSDLTASDEDRRVVSDTVAILHGLEEDEP